MAGARTFTRRRTLIGGAALTACAARRRDDPSVPAADDPRFVALETVEPYSPYQERLAAYAWPTGRGPLEAGTMPATPAGARLVSIASDGQDLAAWFVPGRRPGPAVAYLHNDFALRALAFENARPIADAGISLLLPTFRGENGNGGDFDLLLGQTRDTLAALDWLAAQSGVDPQQVHVIGHSIGGGVAALVCLHDRAAAAITASIGGIYRARTFSSWAASPTNRELVHFDPLDPSQVSLRILGPNLRDMKRPHIAYAGREDRFATLYSQHVLERAEPLGVPLSRAVVEGDHMQSAKPAVLDFVRRLEAFS